MQQLNVKEKELSIKEKESVDKMHKNSTLGYMYASNSLSRFSGQPVFSRLPKVNFNHFPEDIFTEVTSTYQSKSCYVLTTDVIGAVSSKSYLILSEEDAQKIYDYCSETNGLANIPKEELLKEIDNIISAGVVSCFSKMMSTNIFGGVPQLVKVPVNELYTYIDNNIQDFDFDINDYESYMVVSSVLGFSKDKTMAPMFLWVFPDEFYHQVK